MAEGSNFFHSMNVNKWREDNERAVREKQNKARRMKQVKELKKAIEKKKEIERSRDPKQEMYQALEKMMAAGQVDMDVVSALEEDQGWNDDDDDDDAMAELRGIQARPPGAVVIRKPNHAHPIKQGKIEGRYVPGFQYNQTPDRILQAAIPPTYGFQFNRSPVIDPNRKPRSKQGRRSISANGRF